MRRVEWLFGLGAVLVGGAGAVAMGACAADLDSCDKYPHSGCPGYSTSTMSSSSGTMSSSSSSSSGIMPSCVGDPLMDPTLISDKCGIFVSQSAPMNGKGTTNSAFNQLSDAIGPALTQGKYIFVCAETYMPTDTVKIAGAVKIYGNLDASGCKNGGTTWKMADATMTANRATISGPADKIALLLAAASGSVDVYGLNVTAAPAGKKADGISGNGSSIAVFVNGGAANLTNGDFIAGDASVGADGADAPATAATPGNNGNNGAAACSASTVNGAPQTTTMCGGVTSVGGKGGDGNLANGNPGSPGLPTNSGTGMAGAGDDGSVGWSCVGKGGNGTDGNPGVDGPAGKAKPDFGALSETGFVSAFGGDGTDGTPGQGGGGGGGVRGSAALCSGANNGGASGGSGGSGGCGGTAGKGGPGGGSSIALVSANATVILTAVNLTAGKGGDGGRGGNLQPGGAKSNGGSGGTGVASLNPGCDGGKGGKGGSGGPGAGGRGGHSLAIASSGTAVVIDSKSTTTFASMAAKGGPGGSNNVGTNPGADGLAAKCYDFMKDMTCQ